VEGREQRVAGVYMYKYSNMYTLRLGYIEHHSHQTYHTRTVLATWSEVSSESPDTTASAMSLCRS
jgi:hypothetical protein